MLMYFTQQKILIINLEGGNFKKVFLTELNMKHKSSIGYNYYIYTPIRKILITNNN
jgi:hypothetical protein